MALTNFFVQNGIPVLFYQDSISDYSLFRDQHHLNDDGGMILLTKIKRDLLNPIKNTAITIKLTLFGKDVNNLSSISLHPFTY